VPPSAVSDTPATSGRRESAGKEDEGERGGGREGDVGRSPARQQQVCYIYYHDSFFGLRIRVTEWRLKT